MKEKVWLVTGISSGLGKALVETLLKNGQKVAGMTRNKELLSMESESFLPIAIDMKDEEELLKAREMILKKFGTLDVIVNNAAYAIRGALEEISYQEAADSFAVNVFVPLSIIRVFAGILRDKRNGHIFNITSVSGYKAGGFSGIYGSTKFAMEGISEALYQELRPFNVHVTAVKPGDMRTDFHHDRSIIQAEKHIEDYREKRAESLERIRSKYNAEISDPYKIAERIMTLAEISEPPLHIFVGRDSHAKAEKKAKEMLENIRISEAIIGTVDCDD